MRVREAVEADADHLSTLAEDPRDVMLNLIHDRTVRVVEPERTDTGDDDDQEEKRDTPDSGAEDDDAGDPREVPRNDGPDPLGFVSFDARDGVVHVTRIDGDEDTFGRLLEEPVGFARGEGMAVEILVTPARTGLLSAAKDAGFVPAGDGPSFEGKRTTKYRLEPE